MEHGSLWMLRGLLPDMATTGQRQSTGQSEYRTRIIIASILGAVISLQLGAFSVVLETTLSGITELPFSAFVGLMQPIHLAIGLVEGIITAAVLTFVYETRPELLQDVDSKESKL